MQRRGTHKTAVQILRRRRTPDGAGGETISLDEAQAIDWWARIRPLSESEIMAYQSEEVRATHAIYLDAGIPDMGEEYIAWGVQTTDVIRRLDNGQEFEIKAVMPASDGSIETRATRYQRGY